MKDIFCVVLFVAVHAEKLPRSTIYQEGAGNDFKDNYGGGAGGLTGSETGGHYGGEFQDGSGNGFAGSNVNRVKVIQHPKDATSYQSYNLQSYDVKYRQPKKVPEFAYSGYGQDTKNWLGTTLPEAGGSIGDSKELEGVGNTWEDTGSATQGTEVQQDWHKGSKGGVESQDHLVVGHKLVFRINEEFENGQKKRKGGLRGRKVPSSISSQRGNKQQPGSNRPKGELKEAHGFESLKNGWSQQERGITTPKSAFKGQTKDVHSVGGSSSNVWRDPTSGLVGKKEWASQKEDGEMFQGQNTISGVFGSESKPLHALGGPSQEWKDHNDGQKGSLTNREVKQGSTTGHAWVNGNWNSQGNSNIRPKEDHNKLTEKSKTWNHHTEVFDGQNNAGSGHSSKGWERQGNSGFYENSVSHDFKSSNKRLVNQGSDLVNQVRGGELLKGSDGGWKDQGIRFGHGKQNSAVHNQRNNVWESQGVNLEEQDASSKTFEGNTGSSGWWDTHNILHGGQDDKSHGVWDAQKGLEIQGEIRQQGENSGSFAGLNGGWKNQANGHAYNVGGFGVQMPTSLPEGKQNKLYNTGGFTTIWGNPLGDLGSETTKTEGISVQNNVWKNHGGYFKQQTGGSEKLSISSKGQEHEGHIMKATTGTKGAASEGLVNNWQVGSMDTTSGGNKYLEGIAESGYGWNKEHSVEHSPGNSKRLNGKEWGSLSGLEYTKEGWQQLLGGLEVAKGQTRVYGGNGGTNVEWKEQNGGFKHPTQNNVHDQRIWFRGNVGSVGDGSPIKSNDNQGSSFEALQGSLVGVGSLTTVLKHQKGPENGLNNQDNWSKGVTGYVKDLQRPVQGYEYAVSGIEGQHGGFGGSMTEWSTPTSASVSPVKGLGNQGRGLDTETLRGTGGVSQGYGNMVGTLTAAQFNSANNFGGATNGEVSPIGNSPAVAGNLGVNNGFSGWDNMEFVVNNGQKGSGDKQGCGLKDCDWLRDYKGALVAPDGEAGVNGGTSGDYSVYKPTYSFGNYEGNSKGALFIPRGESGVNAGKSGGYPDYSFTLGNYNGKSKGSLKPMPGSESGVNGGTFEGYADNTFSMGNYGGNSNGVLHTVGDASGVNGGQSRVKSDYILSSAIYGGSAKGALNLPGGEYGVDGGKFPQYTYSSGTFEGDSKGTLKTLGSDSGEQGGKFESHPQYTYSVGTYGEDSKGALKTMGSDSGVQGGKFEGHPQYTYSLGTYGANSKGALESPGYESGVNGGKFENYAGSYENMKNYGAVDLQPQETNVKRSDKVDNKLEKQVIV